QAGILARELVELGGVLGLLQRDPTEFLQGATVTPQPGKFKSPHPHPTATGTLSRNDIETFIENRVEARRNKDWAEADRIRDELKQRGVILEDDPDGTTTWRRE
ncbi:MAG: hypothetical protein V3V96_06840, partial [Acidiferrobacterales bacterium]